MPCLTAGYVIFGRIDEQPVNAAALSRYVTIVKKMSGFLLFIGG
jgi:hypothetical protein